MPSSATRTFTDPDMCFAGIRNLQIDGVITKRGEFRAESTRIDLHRLWMHRFDESLPRIIIPRVVAMSRKRGPVSKILGERSSGSTMWQALQASRAKARPAAISPPCAFALKAVT